MAFEDTTNDLEGLVTDGHLIWQIIARTLGDLGLALDTTAEELGQDLLDGAGSAGIGQIKVGFLQNVQYLRTASTIQDNTNSATIGSTTPSLGGLGGSLRCGLGLLLRTLLQYLGLLRLRHALKLILPVVVAALFGGHLGSTLGLGRLLLRSFLLGLLQRRVEDGMVRLGLSFQGCN